MGTCLQKQGISDDGEFALTLPVWTWYPILMSEVVAMQNISTKNQKTRELFATLKLLSPGTHLREGIDYVRGTIIVSSF